MKRIYITKYHFVKNLLITVSIITIYSISSSCNKNEKIENLLIGTWRFEYNVEENGHKYIPSEDYYWIDTYNADGSFIHEEEHTGLYQKREKGKYSLQGTSMKTSNSNEHGGTTHGSFIKLHLDNSKLILSPTNLSNKIYFRRVE